ncbi:MAG: glycosyltransferase family 4 protein [Patescibacteria group bacterium]|nr:glycosyltransferase family 4 protein [Patescibacteria group bacterium]
MNIGIDIRMLGFRHGGIGRYVLELAKNILEIDKQNKYFLFYNNDAEEDVLLLKKINHAKAEFIPVNISHYSIGEQTSFVRILNKYKLDLAHFPNFNVPLLYRKPYVVTIHDAIHHKIGSSKKSHFFHFQAYKKIIANAAKKSRAIITVSEYSRQDIAKYFRVPLNKITVIYEGISLGTEMPADQMESVKRKYLISRPYFLFVGVLERKKNVVNLTRGFDVFIKKYGLDMDLVIAGKVDKHHPEIKHKALDIKFSDRLVFTGCTEDGDLTALYQGAFAFVSASLHEGFGLPGVEAMKHNLPLAVSSLEVFKEIYKGAALYFDPLDTEDIAAKMGQLARDKALYAKLQENGFNRVQDFDWKKTAWQTIKVYEQAIALCANENCSNR